MFDTRLTRIIAVVPLAGWLAGCASSAPPAPVVEHENIFIGSDPVYAELQRRGDGQWTFSRLTENNEDPESGYLVRLNDLSPAFDIRRAECEPRAYRENDRCNPLNPFRKRNMGVVGKIVDTGISAGTGGTISGVSRSYTTDFDNVEFNAAVDQALLLTGLDDNRVALLDGLDRIDGIVTAQEQKVEELRARMLRQYELDKKENIRIDARVSGLIQYYSDDLDPSEFVDVETDVKTGAGEQPAPGVSTAVLPCEANRCVAQLEATLAAMAAQNARELDALRAELESRTDAYVIDCSETSYAGYHFRLHCPDKLQRNPDGVILLPVEIEILSRDFELLFPEFSTDDGKIAAAVSDGRLVLGNRTGDFVDVQSVSVYYNSHINTTSNVDTRLDLAPYQTAGVPVEEFTSPEIEVESRYTNMTPDKASRSTFSFGLAVKYSLRDRDTIDTLYGASDFNVQCAIESRLRPGTCREELGPEDEDTGQPEDSEEDTVSSVDERQ